MADVSAIRDLLRCPACGSELASTDAGLDCTGEGCGGSYPVVQGVPVLIDERQSVMRLADYVPEQDRVLFTPEGTGARSPLRRAAQSLYRLLPEVVRNVGTRENYARFSRLLLQREGRPLVLIVGGREVGKGMEDLLREPGIDFVETDIDFGPRTRMICDAHQLPLADASVDGVVVQAVLEHVLDPHRCVREIHRALKPGGLVYAETPFLYRRHGGAFDFNRFTFLGHRRLFRAFEEIASGVAVGPGSALAVMYMGFLLTLTRRRAVRAALRIFGSLTSFWLKYLDPVLARNDVSLDAAAGFAFLGRRSDTPLSDRELIAGFRGLQ